MGLEADLKAIAKRNKIAESEIILEEVNLFLEEHKSHGGHRVILEYEKGRLSYIALWCTAGDLVHRGICRQHYSGGEEDSGEAIIYSRNITREMLAQKERRERIFRN